MSPKALATGIIVFILLFTVGLPSVSAAENDNGTVSSLFQNNKSNHHSTEKSSGKASGNSSQTSLTSSDSTSSAVIFLKLIFALIIVLGLIYLLYHFVSKRTGRFQSSRSLKNLGGISVGTNRSVQLVQIGEEILVVGVGDTVQLIKEIKNPQVIESLTRPDDETETMEENVLRLLKWTADHTVNRNKKKEADRPDIFTQTLSERLARLQSDRTGQMSKLLQEVKNHE